MSLSRVASVETFQFLPQAQGSRRGSDASSIRAGRLTFNPLPDEWDPAASKPDTVLAVGAFEVPQWKRILQVTIAVIYCLFAAGIAFGFAALKPVLKREGAYSDVCSTDETNSTPDDTCVEIHLNLMFTVAAVGTNIAALPVGALLDHAGPRVCGLVGSVFLIIGSILMAYAKTLPFDGFLIGYLCLALGGPFTYISSFQLSNAFPKHSGFILALMTGAFDASSALFLVYRLIFQASEGTFGHEKFFKVYLIVPVFIIVVQFALMPKQSYKTVGELVELQEETAAANESDPDPYDDQIDENTALLREERRHRESVVADVEQLLGTQKVDKQIRQENKNEISGVWGVMHNRSALRQIASPWFILICLFTVIQMLRINYFVATIRAQYEVIFGDVGKAIEINNFFDVALPVGGILSIPFIGVLLDHTSTVTVLTALVTIATTIGVLGVLDNMGAAYIQVCLFVLYRPFYYTAVSDYSAKVFGFETFGTVYGTIICLSGLFNFLQSGLDVLFHQTFGGDPVPVNVILLSAGLAVGIALVGYVALKARGLKRKMLEQEAEASVQLHN
ncbi:major facilitator superfamily transporter [Colletotrichum abscissum]|uniref:Major facilitator superfamily transporter n=2 Tax=Colletotrichum acutatum species complex TaxID=2707335 RepID=A0A9Q0AXM4_9PEZI|nr:major facilitator superfamily transporter [Colletotrichum abscissum]KAI3535972.1 major facilitator superfamily transporter [Colletotrichum abscissum]KAK1451626.1 major facilitator superfamily transporter [Colletotrichum melonis]KAK1523651.1 major facilitator superfamily transporter [Colletotrichum abscissum]